MSTFLSFLPFLVVLLLFILVGIHLSRQSRQRLIRWLHSQGYQDARFESPPLRPGPFFMLNKRFQGVLRLTVRQADGRERTGWVMYPAALFIEQLSDQEYQAKLVWDDEWDPNSKPLWLQ
jgi:hypothetical protein